MKAECCPANIQRRAGKSRGRHDKCGSVLTRPQAVCAKFFRRHSIRPAAFYKTSLAPVVVRWTRPTVLLQEVRANESSHHHSARAARRRAAARAVAHGHLQRAGGRLATLPERLRPDRRAAQT